MGGRGDGTADGMDVCGSPSSGVVGRGVGREFGVSSVGVRKSALDGYVKSGKGGQNGGEGNTGPYGDCGVNGSREPDKPAMQPKRPVEVEGATVVQCSGELLSLTTVLSLNASCLMESSGRRFREFAVLRPFKKTDRET